MVLETPQERGCELTGWAHEIGVLRELAADGGEGR